MSYDFHAHYALLSQQPPVQAEAADFLTGVRQQPPRSQPELAEVADAGARLQLLAHALASPHKDRARVGDIRGQAGGLLHWLTAGPAQRFLARQWAYLESLSLLPPMPDLALLPTGSFAIHFTFSLASPYISKDDAAFHLLDNPVKKDWVFKLPFIASTQWKGALRHSLWQLGYNDAAAAEEKEQVQRLFGAANDDDDSGERGRLYFYPTFFDQLSLEVINPHDRQTGAGSQPIYFEAVPAGAKGSFTLLYTPLDRIGQDTGETRRQLAADLQLVAEGLEGLFTVYGFGAKTSSGFGLAALSGEGQLAIHYPEAKAQQPRPQEPAYPEIVQQFLANYPAEYLDMKPRQLKEAGVPNLMRQQAREIKALYQQYQQELAQYQAQLAEWEAKAAAAPVPVTIRPFASFTLLSEIIANLPGFEEEKQ